MPPIVGAYERPLSLTTIDEVAVVVVGDVVQRLPRHAARERAVADDGDDVPIVLAGHLEAPRDAVGPATASSTRASSRRCRARTRDRWG